MSPVVRTPMTMCVITMMAVTVTMMMMMIMTTTTTGVSAHEKVPCLFLHGLGQDGPPKEGEVQVMKHAETQKAAGVEKSKLVSSLFNLYGQTYWGDMAKELKDVCLTVTYNFADTNHNAYDSPFLTENYYELAYNVSSAGGVVVAHSMANAILAAACLNSSPDRDAKGKKKGERKGDKCDVRWIDLGGPIRGSKIAEWKIAGEKKKQAKAQDHGKLKKLAAFVKGKKLDKVEVKYSHDDGLLSLVPTYANMAKDPDHPNLLAETVHKWKLAYAVACGVAGGGSLRNTLKTTGGVIGQGASVLAYKKFGVIGQSNDGLVGFEECAKYGDERNDWLVDGHPEGKDYTHRTFRYWGSHLEETGALGNTNHIIDFLKHHIPNLAAKNKMRFEHGGGGHEQKPK